MGKYTVITGQNLYDVALDIYGSIEGITDLLISNPQLSMATRLRAGDILDYSDGYLIDAETVAVLHRDGVTPSGGERHVYFKETSLACRAEFHLPAAATSARFSLSGEGEIQIDWGDNSALQNIVLGPQPSTLTHTFDNVIPHSRVVRLYGSFSLREADFTGIITESLRLFMPLHVEELTLDGFHAPLSFLPLTEGLYALRLRNTKIENLAPLVECRSLMLLDMEGTDIPQQILDEWLIALVKKHYGRRACHIMLTVRPSGVYREPERDDDLNYTLTSGMEAVWLLTHEEAWNEGAPWHFSICGEEYVYEAIPRPEPNSDPEPELEPELEPEPIPPWHSGGMND